jgi:hypothetical protein
MFVRRTPGLVLLFYSLQATRFEDDGLVLVRTSMRHSVEGGGGSAVHVMKARGAVYACTYAHTRAMPCCHALTLPLII